jgi:hypothetical protein
VLPYVVGAVVFLFVILQILKTSGMGSRHEGRGVDVDARKVLKPDVYQHFELVEKMVISHNTAR